MKSLNQSVDNQMKDGLTVFIPVFNEEERIKPNTLRLNEYLKGLGIEYQILIVSNGSYDRTVEIGNQIKGKLSCLTFCHINKKGVGLALKHGINLIEFKKVITVDMDLSIDLEFIKTAYYLLDKYDIVVGSKITGDQKRSFFRRFASFLFIFLARAFLGIKYNDYSIAAKGYRKEILHLYKEFFDDKTFYVTTLLYLASNAPHKIIEVPVACNDPYKSRFNLIHEGIYKFGNLFLLLLKKLIGRPPFKT